MLVNENNKVTGKFICRFGRRREKENGSGRRASCPQIALMICFLAPRGFSSKVGLILKNKYMFLFTSSKSSNARIYVYLVFSYLFAQPKNVCLAGSSLRRSCLPCPAPSRICWKKTQNSILEEGLNGLVFRDSINLK